MEIEGENSSSSQWLLASLACACLYLTFKASLFQSLSVPSSCGLFLCVCQSSFCLPPSRTRVIVFRTQG